jgi:hypothetical protein
MNEQEDQGEQTEGPNEAEGDEQSAQPCPVSIQPSV